MWDCVRWIETVWVRISKRKPGEHERIDVNKCITLHNPENILENESADILIIPVQARYHPDITIRIVNSGISPTM